jgi:hypothetical protein
MTLQQRDLPQRKRHKIMLDRSRSGRLVPYPAVPPVDRPSTLGLDQQPIEERDEFRYSDTRTLRRGDLFRVSRGPQFHEKPYGIRGTFRFESAWMQAPSGVFAGQPAARWYLLGFKIDRDAIDTKTGRPSITSSHVLFVQGPEYPNLQVPGVMMRPYRLHRMLDKTARKAGLQGATRQAALRRGQGVAR